MEKLKDFLHRKDIEISVKRYGIERPFQVLCKR